jgi:hypothetical protein
MGDKSPKNTTKSKQQKATQKAAKSPAARPAGPAEAKPVRK